MQHPGRTPLDFASPIGQLRVEVGDIAHTELEPAVPGQGNYAVWSDNDLAAALARSNGSIPRAAGSLVRSLAIEFSTQGMSIKTDDLAIDVKNRGSDLLAVAKAFFSEADTADAAAGSDYFNIVGFTPDFGETRPRPHLSPATGPTDLDGGTP